MQLVNINKQSLTDAPQPLQTVKTIILLSSKLVQVFFCINSSCYTSKLRNMHPNEDLAEMWDIWAGNWDILQKSGWVAILAKCQKVLKHTRYIYFTYGCKNCKCMNFKNIMVFRQQRQHSYVGRTNTTPRLKKLHLCQISTNVNNFW